MFLLDDLHTVFEEGSPGVANPAFDLTSSLKLVGEEGELWCPDARQIAHPPQNRFDSTCRSTKFLHLAMQPIALFDRVRI